MRKLILSIALSIFIFTFAGFAGDNLKYLKIEEPPSSAKTKNTLLFDMEQLSEIARELMGQESSGSIEFTDQDGNVLVKLGAVQDSDIKWGHETLDGKSLLVKFDKKSDYDAVLGKVKGKAEKPGFMAQFSDAEGTPLGNQGVTFAEASDLAVSLVYPFSAAPGETLADKISVEVENKGNVPAKDVTLELVLSSDIQMPSQLAAPSENFKDDMLLDGGKELLPLIKPGERLTVQFKGSLKIPADTTLGRYYLGALIDPENKIKEVNKDNNTDVRLFMVSLPEPKRITLLLPDAELVYNPVSFDISVISHGLTLSDAKEWRKCNIKLFVFQFKHAAWEDFHWEADTSDSSLWLVKGANFCKKGGTAKEIKLKVETTGGSKTELPSLVKIKLSDARMEYEPGEGKFRILSNENQIAYASQWQFAKTKPCVYQIRHQSWTDCFWELDTIKKEVRKITDGKFGYDGGNAAPTDIKLTSE